MKSYFGGAKQRRLRSDELVVPKAPDSGTSCSFITCMTCRKAVIAANDAYWHTDEQDRWQLHEHQPQGDDVWRDDPLNGGK